MKPTLTPFEYHGDFLEVLDQRSLPNDVKYIVCRSASDVASAITSMAVRGAPAIAIAAAYGMALSARRSSDMKAAASLLLNSRPTAVHLKKVIDRMMVLPREAMEAEARKIHREDLDINIAIGRHGTAVLPADCHVYHHCNTGALATGGWGTALGIVRSMAEIKKLSHVWVGETRPYLQGARLTAWEMMVEKIPYTLVSDNMAAKLMSDGKVDAVLVGCDRVARNGDTANKIGTLSLAVLAHHYRVPFYVAMPLSALDEECATGEGIPIEERPAIEMLGYGFTKWAHPKTPVYNPGFDVTPAALITGWVTEQGLWRPQP
jgi:methylthioribose-1-phosphate isomerase